MNPRSRPRKSAALLLLLLALSLGSFVLFPIAFPGYSPAWLNQLFGMEGGVSSNIPPGTDTDSENSSTSKSREGSSHDTKANGDPGGRYAHLDPKAMPKGLTTIDGEGGTGLNRAVRKNGVWFPVYSPGPRSDSSNPPLTVIPLSIASGPPTPGQVNQPFRYQAEAIGGTPPYTWTANLGPAAADFIFDRAGGFLTGTSESPVSLTFALTVSDAAGSTDSAQMLLTIRPEKELTIETADLPAARPGESFKAALSASGGVPPYTWTALSALPVGLKMDAGSGLIRGTTEETGEFPIEVRVTDQQTAITQKSLVIRCQESLEITTPSALPTGVPGEGYRGEFAATGGTPPYQWEVVDGFLPDSSWKLSPDGILTGQGGLTDLMAAFTLQVTDAMEERYEKTFRLVISDLLVVVPSQEKAGIAWHPAAVASLLGQGSTSASGFQLERDGVVIYSGSGTNFVDKGLKTGSTPRYTLVALTIDGDRQELAHKQVAILPQTLTRAEPGVTGDPFADRLVSFQPLTPGGYGSAALPRNVTGPPDGRSVYAPAYKPGEVLSLHARRGAGGWIDLEFTDNIVEISAGEDVTVFENVLFIGGNGNQRFMEPARISVGLFPGEWISLPCDVVPPAGGAPPDMKDPFYYARGFAGRNGTTGGDPTNPNRSGGDSLDLDEAAARAGLSWIRYIRIQSTGDQAVRDDSGGDLILHPDDPAFNPLSGTGSSGFDLDAVTAVHY